MGTEFWRFLRENGDRNRKKVFEGRSVKSLHSENPMKITSGQPKTGSDRKSSSENCLQLSKL